MALQPGSLDPRQLHSVLANAPHPVWVKDTEGRYTLVNHAFELAFGVREADVLGRTAEEVLPASIAARAREHDAAVLRSGSNTVCEESTELDGVGIEAVVVRFPIHDEHGVIVAVGGIATDVTRQARAHRQLHELHGQVQHSQRLQSLGALANGIVHDFNNILLAISGYTELAQRSLPDNHEVQPMLAEALAAACRARELVTRLTDFGRQGQPDRLPQQLLQLVDDALRLLLVNASSRVTILGPRQVTPPSRTVPTVLGDSTQLLQVIMNLCMNALHAMPDGGTLEVRLDERVAPGVPMDSANPLPPGPYVVLSVTDTGQGMDGSVLARIFDPYYTTKPRGQGSGLGLAVVRGIVEAHSGEIFVESAPGRGTRFEVWLPTAASLAAVTRS
jgi:two-component system, cell cycle sensor histidine kinase and response regulator CckA